MRSKTGVLLAIILLPFLSNCQTEITYPETFKKTILTREFLSEGVAVADLNNDGLKDIVAGYYWFEAPNWTKHEMAPARAFNPRQEYSKSFLNFTLDVNLDGWEDVVNIDYPGTPAYWFENPKNEGGNWTKHIIGDSIGIGNESPGFIDVDADGRIDLLCGDVKTNQIIWLQAPTQTGQTAWTRHALTEEKVYGTERFSHGLGYGDINGDGIKDVVIKDGWFEGKADKSSGDWRFHLIDLGEDCSHMQVLDVNKDGRNDIVTASAHKLGIWWFEQLEDGNFKKHLMSESTSQTHSSIMVDLNGDDKKDFLTGKRYLAHNGNDPGDADAPILIWFEFTDQAPYYKEHFIDNDSGAGLNIATADMNNDFKTDIIISNKNGVFLLENDL
ncbi:FG-GAP repeat domain-containing protein [Arcticibacterium luteifluviistationis]|uniref:VCBS repeat-containing protein n=1 Tax=Arcticibacterium luteifluviistationis TaxID=1784714 RepID=A0A2Z4GC03_9BACT|nr:VCBS repeat-containing protein [Arcticibacterium luteifluviistationis]AWV98736.1 hypothetical protein DJ013_11355 [Arcticibacterium luteifluviistationis]